MSSEVEVSPSGIGFVRTTARKSIPGVPDAVQGARRRSWLGGRYESKTNTGSTAVKSVGGRYESKTNTGDTAAKNSGGKGSVK